MPRTAAEELAVQQAAENRLRIDDDIKNRKGILGVKDFTLDAGVKEWVGIGVNMSATGATQFVVFDGRRDIIVQRISIMPTETLAAAGTVQVGKYGDNDFFFTKTVPDASAAGTEVELRSGPFRVLAGEFLTISHLQIASNGEWAPKVEWVFDRFSSNHPVMDEAV